MRGSSDDTRTKDVAATVAIKCSKKYLFGFEFVSFSIGVGFCKLQIAKLGDDFGLSPESESTSLKVTA